MQFNITHPFIRYQYPRSIHQNVPSVTKEHTHCENQLLTKNCIRSRVLALLKNSFVKTITNNIQLNNYEDILLGKQ